MKRLPSRNNRSKGIKVKHVLQICLLLGVCFWLIYQVKHSHDKKREFDEKDAKNSVKAQGDDQILKFGRKDLKPRVDEDTKHVKPEEEEEDETTAEDEENKHEEERDEEENKHEVEEREEENKHEGEEQEEDENASEETEDGAKGGDDEIDDNEREESEAEVDRDEEFLDEEKEKEEGDEKENEKNVVDDKDNLVESQNTREAREEHYKGDDASSAVTHDTQTATEVGNERSENSNKNSKVSILEEGSWHNTEEANRNFNTHLKATEGEMTKSRISLNATSGEENGNTAMSNSLIDSQLNATVISSSGNHMESGSNVTVLITGATDNSTESGGEANHSSHKNEVQMLSELANVQNTTHDGTVSMNVKNVQSNELRQNNETVSEGTHSGLNSTTSQKNENGDETTGKTSYLETTESENNTTSEATNDAKNLNSSNTTENINATEDEKPKGYTKSGETDETSNMSSEDTNSDALQHDPIDTTDSQTHDDLSVLQTDLETLPDSRNESDNSEETAAE